MQKLIFFSLASLIIITPNIAFSQSETIEISEQEYHLTLAVACKYKLSSKSKILRYLKKEANFEISNKRLKEIANEMWNEGELPPEIRSSICEYYSTGY